MESIDFTWIRDGGKTGKTTNLEQQNFIQPSYIFLEKNFKGLACCKRRPELTVRGRSYCSSQNVQSRCSHSMRNLYGWWMQSCHPLSLKGLESNVEGFFLECYSNITTVAYCGRSCISQGQFAMLPVYQQKPRGHRFSVTNSSGRQRSSVNPDMGWCGGTWTKSFLAIGCYWLIGC